MGKYAATRKVRDSKFNKANSNWTMDDNALSRWLYGDWSESKLHEYEMLSRIPFIGEYMDYLLDVRADEEYLNRYGMTYSDIHNPKKLKQTYSGSRMYGSMLSVSENIALLYR